MIPSCEIFSYDDSLPVFGSGHYLHLGENGSGSCYAHSNSYEKPKSVDPNCHLAGQKYFNYTQVEVFRVKGKSRDPSKPEAQTDSLNQTGGVEYREQASSTISWFSSLPHKKQGEQYEQQ